MQPRFSIITCTYNRANIIGRTIKSVINQSYKDFELIIIDDGSTDNTKGVIKYYKDKRIKYFKYKNGGELSAKNRGMSNISGKYFVFLDSDDELSKNALENISKKIKENKDLGILLFNCTDFNSQIKVGNINKNNGDYIYYEDIISKKIDGDFCRVTKSNLIGNLQFDYRLIGGLIFWLKIHKKSKCKYFKDVVYLVHRENKDRMSNFQNQLKNISKIILSNKEFLRIHGENIKNISAKEFGKRLSILGFWELLNNQKSEARRNLYESLRYHLSIISVIIIILSFILNNYLLRKLSVYIIR